MTTTYLLCVTNEITKSPNGLVVKFSHFLRENNMVFVRVTVTEIIKTAIQVIVELLNISLRWEEENKIGTIGRMPSNE
jgi:hypothetical protein